MQYLQERLQIAVSAVLEAGEKVIAIYNSEFDITWKKKDDPLTEADLAANEIVTCRIHDRFPNDGFVSEEVEDNDSRNHADLIWVLDPIDGTREFVSKNPEFAVSLGLVADSKPVMGIVFNPVTGELFLGIQKYGFQYCQVKRPFLQNIPDIKLQPPKPHQITANPPTCLVSRSEYRENIYQTIPKFTQKYQLQPTGSIAYKLALLAAGKADSLISVYGKNDWDICAGVALAEAAGMKVLELTTLLPIDFNSSDLYTRGIIAVSPTLSHEFITDPDYYKSLYRLRKSEQESRANQTGKSEEP